MDKLSLKVLKYISSKQDNVSVQAIKEMFGDTSKKSLLFLEKEGLIKSGRIPIGCDRDLKPILQSDGLFSITSTGLAFLEEKPGKDFDRWLTRFCAIWGAITGTAALILEAVLHFL